jgi:hypothetical protein
MNRTHLGQVRRLLQQRLDAAFVAEDQEARLRKPQPRDIGSLDDHARGEVTAHGIQGNGYAVGHR